MSRLPESLEGPGGIVVRLWAPGDAEALNRAVAESVEHLRQWMGWAWLPPMPIARRREWIAEQRAQWEAVEDAVYGVFADGEVAGGAGLHRRIGPDGLEIGYWTRIGFLRRGIASRAAALLAEAALSLPGITHVEIHHDRANLASRGVPAGLGFVLVAERPDEIHAPAEEGIECVWRLERGQRAPSSGSRHPGGPGSFSAASGPHDPRA